MIRATDDYDTWRENQARHAQEDRDDAHEDAEAERDRWQFEGGVTADDLN